MTGLRSEPPDVVGDLVVELVTDLLATGTGLPPTDALVLELDGRVRLVMRPSGTEPKLKLYGEAVVDPVDDDLAAARARAADRLDRAMDAMSTLIQP